MAASTKIQLAAPHSHSQQECSMSTIAAENGNEQLPHACLYALQDQCRIPPDEAMPAG